MSLDYFPREILESHVFSTDGLHRVAWEDLYAWAEENLNGETWVRAWDQAELFAAEKLCESLAGNYRVTATEKVILASGLSLADAEWVVKYATRVLDQIGKALPGLARNLDEGREVIFIFSDQDTYYRYISHYDPDGEHAQSGGIFLPGYSNHVALPWWDQPMTADVLFHELIHSVLAHHSLPLWLNEGLTQSLERSIGPNVVGAYNSEYDGPLDADLAERHFAYWTPETIQSFWTGDSFSESGDPQELSYSLAEILTKLICEKISPAKFNEFIAASSYEDAGQSAALQILNLDLGEVAATFLGPGGWSPATVTKDDQ